MATLTNLLVLFCLSSLVSGEFSLSFQFHRYSNPSRLDAAGECCDCCYIFGCPSCETLFQSLCVRDGSTSVGAIGQCITGTVHNPGYVGSDTIEFGASIGSLINPFGYTGTAIAQSGYQLYLEVYDEDTGTDDLMDRIVVELPGHPSSVQSGALAGIFGRASLVLSYTLACSQHYYNTDCSVYCLPRNDAVNGHYTCNATTGAIVCRPGWQNTTNNCRDVACQLVCQSPGGDCTPNGVCQCLEGWSGDQCTIPKCTEGCHPQGGYCEEPNQCLCHTNWNGTFCNQSLCDTNCSSIGGVCMEPTVCTCLNGYTGQACEIDFLPCENQRPCNNGGNCSHTDDIGEYSCTCLMGFTGTDCEVDIDECSIEEPCFNNGTCINGEPGSFKCICASGWTGDRCSSSIDYCVTQPCSNNGTCNNLATGYYCTCIPQYEGLNCEVMVNACLPNPCQNNGTCTNLITNYTCTCTEGYTGPNCAINVSLATTSVSVSVTTTSRPSSQVGIIGAAAGGGGIILITTVVLIVVATLVICIVMRKRRSVKGKDSYSLVDNKKQSSTKVIISGEANTEVEYDVPDEGLLKTVTNAVYGETSDDTYRYTYSKLNRTASPNASMKAHNEQLEGEKEKQALYMNSSVPQEQNNVANPVYGSGIGIELETENVSSVPNPMYGESRNNTLQKDTSNEDSLLRSTLEKGEEGMYSNPSYGGSIDRSSLKKKDDTQLTYDSIPDMGTSPSDNTYEYIAVTK